MTPAVPTRYAIVQGRKDYLRLLEHVQAYLPANYTAAKLEDGTILIQGKDDHGWTLDGYVIPRLGSGLIPARETSAVDAAIVSISNGINPG